MPLRAARFDPREVGSGPRTALATAITVALGLLLPRTVHAGDILRGGVSAGARRTSAPVAQNPAVVEQARANAKDILVRTAQTAQAMQAMQNAARQLAQGGANNLGRNPNAPATQLPNVPDGLAQGGLKVASGVGTNPSLWQGAQLPRQTTANGATRVTVQQTQQQALLNWETFNIGRNTTLAFDQSAGGASARQWVAINKVNDPSGVPSQILGSIQAAGQVYVINRNGIIFGGSSQVNVHTLVASSLPINDNLVSRGLLNNPDQQFLFTSKPIDAGANGTPAFDPGPVPAQGYGDVIVQKGARISTPTNTDHVGGRVALVGRNVTNSGIISTPDGQTILAAGEQVGMAAHPSSDPSLRGLDVYVGSAGAGAGSAVNTGVIDVPRGSASLVGKNVTQGGFVSSTTSVSLNGRVDLLASYDAVSNASYDAANVNSGTPFLNKSTGTVEVGEGSVIQILPETWSAESVVGTGLALNSQVNMQGQAVHLAAGSTVFAPGAQVRIDAGRWNYSPQGSPPSQFAYTGGQIYLDSGARISVAGSSDVSASLLQNILDFQILGAEVANSPVQRDGVVRGQTVQIDMRQTGTYNGADWTGTPIADASGYVGLVKRTVGELAIGGGTVNLSAGGSVVTQGGSNIDVSGGWISYAGAMVKTTRLWSGQALYDISKALPDRVYTGIYTGTITVNYSKWGVSETYAQPLALTGYHYEPGYLHGGNAGSITINAPAVALDGSFLGLAIAGPRQRKAGANTDPLTLIGTMPASAGFTLNLRAQDDATSLFYSPTPPTITFEKDSRLAAAGAFTLDANGTPADLPAQRKANVVLPSSLVNSAGFGFVTIDNSDGGIAVPSSVTLQAPAGGALQFHAANISIGGALVVPGGKITLQSENLSPYAAAPDHTPAPDPSRGSISIGAGAVLSTRGLIVDDRASYGVAGTQPRFISGGMISVKSFNADFAAGSSVDVSGGVSVSSTGKRTYGDGGAIEIEAGKDPLLGSLIGGRLTLGANLTGFSGAKAGSLSVLAPLVQIGGTTANADTLLLSPDFFSHGGFGSFSLAGIGAATSKAGEYLPGVLIAPGTVIAPQAQSLLAVNVGNGISLQPILRQQGVRTPVGLSFSAPGVTDSTGGGTTRLIRGDVIFGEGAQIVTDAFASVTLRGNAVSVLGSIRAPGGAVTIGGSLNSAGLFAGQGSDAATVFIGPRAVISAAGTTLATVETAARGLRTGTVVDGGSITVSGNIVAREGALLDVSGTSATLFYPRAYAGLAVFQPSLRGQFFAPLTVDSSGGTISLNAGASVGQILFTDATLRGGAGGPGASGGSLLIGSQLGPDVAATPLDPTLILRQGGATIPVPASTGLGLPVRNADASAIAGLAHFTVDRFAASGLDSIALNGTVQLSGAVKLTAARSIILAAKTSSAASNGGVIFADASASISAPYVQLGRAFETPTNTAASPFTAGGSAFSFSPTIGAGSLAVSAQLVDVGNLSLQGIGRTLIAADGGDIRGDGTFNTAGALTLRAEQIYPASAVKFTIAAFTDTVGGQTSAAKISIASSGARALPLSAGGELSIYAPIIEQGGVLRAPFGSVRLGWDGTGTAPVNAVTGTGVAATQQLTLRTGSITSVSGVDPATGSALTIPYGINVNGSQWIAPTGSDITVVGIPAGSVSLGAADVSLESGATVDLRGGGEIYAYRFVSGNGGTRDVLNSAASFAVIPGYSANIAPYAPNNASSDATNLASSDPGYVNTALKVGDRVWLEASGALPAGAYTLLPARYALLPGAVLVTPKTGASVGTRGLNDGASIVSGKRFNGLAPVDTGRQLTLKFEVAPQSVVRARAQYEDYFAGSFFAGTGTSRPADSAHLSISAANALTLSRGAGVLAASVAGGAGGQIDFSSPANFLIAVPGVAVPAGTIVLDPSVVSSFGAGSLLIGGTRSTATGVTQISVATSKITVDNAGAPLTGSEIILAAKQGITISADAQLVQSGAAPSSALQIGTSAIDGSSDGVLVWLTQTPGTLSRPGKLVSALPSLAVGAGAKISGSSVTLDSTASSTLDPAASISAGYLALNAGRISLLFSNPGPLPGLVLSGPALASVQQAKVLSLLSYSSLDLYGSGQFTTGNLELHAAEIRGFTDAGGTVAFNTGSLLLDNSAGKTGPGLVSPAQFSGGLEFNAGTIRIGSNQLAVDQFETVTLNAAGGVLVQGTGGLSTQGALTIAAPLIVGAASANQAINAGGKLTLAALPGAASLSAGLGASLSLTGTEVVSGTTIALPSGTLSLRATTGGLTVSGLADAGGIGKTFFDETRFTDGGRITLTSDLGAVDFAAGGRLSVAAQQGGGSAGSVVINAKNGGFTIGGTLDGSAGPSGSSGSFSLDVGSLAEIKPLNAALDAAGFGLSRTVRVRTGDVAVGGTGTAASFSISADAGKLTVDGTLNAHGATGGSISLYALKDVTLASTAVLDVSGDGFDAAGKGGTVTLETRGDGGATVSIAGSSRIELGVAGNTGAAVVANAALGKFNGTLHVRAPQNAAGSDLQVSPIDGTISNASSIVVEGYRVYTPAAGVVDGVKGQIFRDAQNFTGVAGAPATQAYTDMQTRLLGGNTALIPLTSIQSGAEIVNSASASTVLPITLNTSGTSAISVAGGVPVTFTTGTVGTNRVRFSAAGTITVTDGTTTTTTSFAANSLNTLSPGSIVTFNGTGTGVITFASGSGGAIPVSIPNGAQFSNTAGAITVAGAGAGSIVQLNAVNSAFSVNAGAPLVFTTGTVGTNRVRFSAAATVTSPAGVVTTVAANTATAITAGSSVTLATTGTVTFASGTGGAIPIAVGSSGTVTTTAGTSTVTAPNANLTLLNNWDLQGYRFGPDSAPGVLTLRAGGNLVFNFKASLSDGFTTDPLLSYTTDATFGLWARTLSSTRSWSYRLVAGADFSAADFHQVQPLAGVGANTGSLLLGSGATALPTTGTSSTVRSNIIPNFFQTIRTGTGDIDIAAARDVQLLNSLATIYTAGMKAPDIAGFDQPVLNYSNSGTLGAAQTPFYLAQYSLAGGNVTIAAQNDIGHYLASGSGASATLTVDSTREMPTNWLYRRSTVGADGQFSLGLNGDVRSTTWWVDFSNFFEGVGALGGGNVRLAAGRDVVNVDAVAPTNARMPKGVPDTAQLIELGGGNVTVSAGRDVSGGAYYVERGEGIITARRAVTTNSARAAVTRTQLAAAASTPTTWLPTTLFLGKSSFTVNAGGDLLLGPVANPFLLPQGLNNTFVDKTYFSTYSADASVAASSLSGSVTVRDYAITGAGSLANWYQNGMLFSTAGSFAISQPWLRLAETRIASGFVTAASLMAPTLKTTAFSGDVNLVGSLTLAPSPTGTVEIFAAGSVNGVRPNAVVAGANNWGSGTINLSDADPLSIPGITSPLSFDVPEATTSPFVLSTLSALFAESGSYTGAFAVLQSKLALHGPGPLHGGDTEPLRIYAGSGDISGLTLYSAKFADIFAGRDISDVALYVQNVNASDVSTVAAGRDIVAYQPNSLLRLAAQTSGNQLFNFAAGTSGPTSGRPAAGDIQISGPGTLEVLAGRHLDLGIGLNNPDGTGTGITSIGNARNPYLPFTGADIIAGAGVNSLSGIGGAPSTVDAFLTATLTGSNASRYLGELGAANPDAPASLQGILALSAEQRKKLALQLLFIALRDAGRDHNDATSAGYGSYSAGFAAISSLFPAASSGDITTRARDIRTKSGGSISLLTPGGGLSLVSNVTGTLAPPGIITEDGGGISIFADRSVQIGVSRIFTLRGGDIVIWSSKGDIAAGAAAKTVQSAPPTRVLVDPQSGSVQTDLAGLATGGGIGVLATVTGVAPGNVDLIAPTGTIDAGDAGIRSSGNLNVAAVQVVNAQNIQVSGSSSGTPAAATVSAPNLGTLTAGNTTAGATASTVKELGKAAQPEARKEEQPPSLITVEVLGYGGGD